MSGLLHLVLLALVCDSLMAATWVGLRIVPTDVVLSGPGRTQKFLVLGRDVDGNEKDVTANAQLRSSAPDVVVVDSRLGVLTARRRGQATVKATAHGIQTSATVRVADSPSELSVRFSPDVISVLTIKGKSATLELTAEDIPEHASIQLLDLPDGVRSRMVSRDGFTYYGGVRGRGSNC